MEGYIPDYDPPEYDPSTAPSPAPIPQYEDVPVLSAIPESDVLVAEDLDIDMKIRESEFKMKGEIIKKNNELKERIDKLETILKICCDTDWEKFNRMSEKIQSRFRGNKDRNEMKSKYPETFYKVTKGWTIFKNSDSYPHHNNPGTDKINIPFNKEKTLVNKYCGFTLIPLPPHVYYREYGINNCLNNVLQVTSREYQKLNPNFLGPCDFYLAPGASLNLIKQKINEGFEVEFEDKHDKVAMDLLLGKKGGGKKNKRTYKKLTKKGKDWVKLAQEDMIKRTKGENNKKKTKKKKTKKKK